MDGVPHQETGWRGIGLRERGYEFFLQRYELDIAKQLRALNGHGGHGGNVRECADV